MLSSGVRNPEPMAVQLNQNANEHFVLYYHGCGEPRVSLVKSSTNGGFSHLCELTGGYMRVFAKTCHIAHIIGITTLTLDR